MTNISLDKTISKIEQMNFKVNSKKYEKLLNELNIRKLYVGKTEICLGTLVFDNIIFYIASKVIDIDVPKILSTTYRSIHCGFNEKTNTRVTKLALDMKDYYDMYIGDIIIDTDNSALFRNIRANKPFDIFWHKKQVKNGNNDNTGSTV